MTPTSDTAETARAVNPFFTPAQILAFSLPPQESALGSVKVSGNQSEKYVQGDYITLLLNQYVGPGMWDRRIEYISDGDEILTKRRKVKVNGRETGDWEDYKMLQVSATLKTTLIIYARDGSDRTKQYEAVTVGTGITDPKNGRADALENAIKSAETDGLKRTSKCLGRAFGLDLKGKIKQEMMPKPLRVIEAQINAMVSAAQAANDQSDAAALPAPAIATVSQPAPAAATAHVAPQPTASAPAVVTNAAPSPTPTPARPEPRPAAQFQGQQQAPATPQVIAANDGLADQGQTSQTTGQTHELPEWDLSMMPSTYENWLACLKTMERRLNRMTHPQEIANFCNQRARTIKKLPVLPAEDGRPAMNFVARWEELVNARLAQLNQAAQSQQTRTA